MHGPLLRVRHNRQSDATHGDDEKRYRFSECVLLQHMYTSTSARPVGAQPGNEQHIAGIRATQRMRYPVYGCPANDLTTIPPLQWTRFLVLT
jgi:hypothetical protein